MFKDIAIIQKDLHADHKVGQLESMSFSKKVSHVPTAVSEFFLGCKSQPILFVKNEEGYGCVSLVGLKQDTNLFLDAKQQWISGEYCPAFLRHYPFIFVQNGETLSLGYDAECKAVNTKKGESFFTKEGEPTEFSQNVLEVMNRYQADMQVTQAFTKKLDELGLLEPMSAEVRVGQDGYKFEGFFKISEEKLNGLTEETKLELLKMGYYNLIIAHLISLSSFDKLAALASHKK
jgi:hypothetical protein